MDIKQRKLDGMYFRIKRGSRYQDICFSDMTTEERLEVLNNKDVEFMKRMSLILAEKIREIGDKFDIVGE
ncbi:MAG: hypothetical protein NC299_15630 [Lachnospiraceae bacterium]|nr:hypothetical protein [Lachnospiraceae bacterium]